MKKLGELIEIVDVRNKSLLLGEDDLFGVSVTKRFIESHANLVGVDFKPYKIVDCDQFCYIPVTSRNGDKVSIAKNDFKKRIIVSSAYIVFKIKDVNVILPDFLMIFFMNPEFDRLGRYHSWGSAREVLSWEDLTNFEIDVPPIEKQKESIKRLISIHNRISILESINQKLSETMDIFIEKHLFSTIGLKDLDDVFSIELPSNWSIMKLSELGECQSGYAFYKNGYSDDGTAIVDLGNITIRGEYLASPEDKKVNPEDYCNEKFDKFRLKKNDLIMVMTDRKSTMELLGKTAIVDSEEELFLNQRVFRIRCSNVDYEFIYPYLNSSLVHYYHMARAQGTAQKYVNNGDIEGLPVIIPDERTFEKICSLCKPIVHQQLLNKKEIEKLLRLTTYLNTTNT